MAEEHRREQQRQVQAWKRATAHARMMDAGYPVRSQTACPASGTQQTFTHASIVGKAAPRPFLDRFIPLQARWKDAAPPSVTPSALFSEHILSNRCRAYPGCAQWLGVQHEAGNVLAGLRALGKIKHPEGNEIHWAATAMDNLKSAKVRVEHEGRFRK